jgi:hypothetical protein
MHIRPFHIDGSLNLQVDDVDAWCGHAAGAGAKGALPLQEMVWGDRYGQLRGQCPCSSSSNGPPCLGHGIP